MAAWFIKLSGIVIPLLIAAALQFGEFESMCIAIALIVFACLWGLGLLIIWIRRAIKARREGHIVGSAIKVESIAESNYGRAGRTIGLKVSNWGVDGSENCSGQLVMLDFVTPQERVTLSGWPVEHLLRWADRPSGYRHIAAGAKAVLDVVYWEWLTTAAPGVLSPVYISYVGDEEFRREHGIHVEWGGVILVIGLTSTGMMPTYVVCVFDKGYSGFGYQVQLLDGNLTERPTIDECRQLLRSHSTGTASQ